MRDPFLKGCGCIHPCDCGPDVPEDHLLRQEIVTPAAPDLMAPSGEPARFDGGATIACLVGDGREAATLPEGKTRCAIPAAATTTTTITSPTSDAG